MSQFDPADVAVLAVGVVVALLGATELVAGQQHWRALAEQQRGQHIADLPGADTLDFGIVGRALDAAVPGPVVGRAVVVVFAVRVVVLLVVGNAVVQREAIMSGDEVDAGPGLAALAVELLRAAQ